MVSYFDWKFYINFYTDLQNNDINNESKAWEHWIENGMFESRKGCCDDDLHFDWNYYTNFYSDLQYYNINTEYKAWKHWINYGKNEGRICYNNIKPKINKNCEKKKVAFLFSGQSRTNSLNHKYRKDNLVCESIQKNVLTNEFKNKYKYDIFISTDDLHIENTFNFFGKENIKNMHFFDTGYYLNEISYNIKSYDEMLVRYKNHNFEDNQIYENNVCQYYRLYDCYNLLCNYANVNDYDYIIRIRLDSVINVNITRYLECLDLYEKKLLFGFRDEFGIGRVDIMHEYALLVKTLADYKIDDNRYNFIGNEGLITSSEYYQLERKRWNYAAETQLYERLFKYCNRKGYSIDDSICVINNYGYLHRN